jgi:NAD(P)-dependent dehydrogenase (short-subunit alcohol dehydrogenase family)
MIKQGSGRIISIGSLVALHGGLFVTPAYSAAKSGLYGMTKLAARWLGKYGINVNVVNPGPVVTPGAIYGKDQLDAYARQIPLKRKSVDTVLGLPEDMANAVLFLASDLSSYVTGSNINVVGGQWMG